MDERVKEYLEKKQAECWAEEEKRRADLLIQEGLYTERELSERPEEYTGVLETEVVTSGAGSKYINKVPLPVTKEEWEQIKKYAEKNEAKPEKSSVASLLKILAIVVYVSGFLLGFARGKDLYGDFSFIMVLTYWILGLFSGTMLLGFSEVVRLLHEINQKTK